MTRDFAIRVRRVVIVSHFEIVFRRTNYANELVRRLLDRENFSRLLSVGMKSFHQDRTSCNNILSIRLLLRCRETRQLNH